MEKTLVHIAETAAWFFGIVFAFAAIGVYATIHWFVNLFTRARQAVESGVDSVERRL